MLDNKSQKAGADVAPCSKLLVAATKRQLRLNLCCGTKIIAVRTFLLRLDPACLICIVYYLCKRGPLIKDKKEEETRKSKKDQKEKADIG